MINADNGPENHSRRTQFMHRLVNWVNTEQIPIQLAYYPPYHSKYNEVEKKFHRLPGLEKWFVAIPVSIA